MAEIVGKLSIEEVIKNPRAAWCEETEGAYTLQIVVLDSQHKKAAIQAPLYANDLDVVLHNCCTSSRVVFTKENDVARQEELLVLHFVQAQYIKVMVIVKGTEDVKFRGVCYGADLERNGVRRESYMRAKADYSSVSFPL